MDINLQREFTIGEPIEYEYEHWVNLTAKMLKRPYIQVHRLVQDLPLSEIRHRYILATKHNGDMPSYVYWWWYRKTRK